MSVREIIVGVVATLALSCTAAAGAPRVVTGWPVVAAAGSVHPGPGGGPVLIAEGFSGFGEGNQIVSSVAAFERNGRRRWLSAYEPGCGNCDGGPQVPGLLADGTYGPIGVEGDDFWGVDQRGVRVAGCAGAVLADGTCIRHEVRGGESAFAPTFPAIAARRGSTTLWEYTQPTQPWSIRADEGVPPIVLASPTTVYTSLGPHRYTGQHLIAQQLIALNLSDGALRWRVFDATPLAVLGASVIGETAAGLALYADDGTVRWAASLPANVFVSRVLVDEAHGRVYVSLIRIIGGRRSEVFELVALDAATGAELWRSKPVERARPLSVGSNGLVYAGVDRSGRHALVAIGLDGKRRWQFDTTTRVEGARLLSDGTVVVSTSGLEVGDLAGLLWRVDPRRAAIGASSSRLTLSRANFRGSCIGYPTPTCEYSSDLGTVMRIAISREATLQVRVLRTNGSALGAVSSIPAPAGVSYVRLLTFFPGFRGRRIIDVRGTVGRRLLHVRFPVVIR